MNIDWQIRLKELQCKVTDLAENDLGRRNRHRRFFPL